MGMNAFMKTNTLGAATRLDAYLEFGKVRRSLGSFYIPRLVLFVLSEHLSLLLLVMIWWWVRMGADGASTTYPWRSLAS